MSKATLSSEKEDAPKPVLTELEEVTVGALVSQTQVTVTTALNAEYKRGRRAGYLDALTAVGTVVLLYATAKRMGVL